MLQNRSAGVASLPSITAITSNLLQISTPREPSDPNGHPPELGHQLRQPTARTGASTALRNLKNIEQKLRGNALDAVIADFTMHPFQRQPPGLGTTRSQFGLRFMQLAYQRQAYLHRILIDL